MLSSMKKVTYYSVVTSFMLALAVCGGCGRNRYLDGKSVAREDLKNGKLRVAVQGHNLMEEFYPYQDLLRKRYQIGLLTYDVDPENEEKEWVDGYNSLMMPEIDKKWGLHVLKDALNDARAEIQDRIPTNRPQ